MINVHDKMFPAVENMLDWTAKRQQTISANLTNIDTPGYKAKDVSFAEHMQSLGLDKTSAAHFGYSDTSSMRIYEVGTTAEKPNGNTVDLDREMTELSKNGLQYIALVQFLNQKIRTLRSVINDGGKV